MRIKSIGRKLSAPVKPTETVVVRYRHVCNTVSVYVKNIALILRLCRPGKFMLRG